jgi:hypothetical protein
MGLTLAGLVPELEGMCACGYGKDEALRYGFVLSVVGVIRVEDAVDPGGTVCASARHGIVGAL